LTQDRTLRRARVARFALEVALIATGVFLGLLGDQWRERAEQRDLARASLRRFRAEIVANRAALASQTAYHDSTLKALQAFFGSSRPKTPANFDVAFHGLGPVAFEQTAWDLALATQALAYMDPDLAYALSRTYTIQRGYAGQQGAITQSTIYGRSWTQDFEGYWRSVLGYYGDLAYLDPTLLRAYDEVLPRIDRALGAPPAGRTGSR
jgi:hypothetical protein